MNAFQQNYPIISRQHKVYQKKNHKNLKHCFPSQIYKSYHLNFLWKIFLILNLKQYAMEILHFLKHLFLQNWKFIQIINRGSQRNKAIIYTNQINFSKCYFFVKSYKSSNSKTRNEFLLIIRLWLYFQIIISDVFNWKVIKIRWTCKYCFWFIDINWNKIM
jgi:hypothetical protein